MLYSTTCGLQSKSGEWDFFCQDVTKTGFLRIIYGKCVVQIHLINL